MTEPGQIILVRSPQSVLAAGKLRPALLFGKLLGEYDDWLVCMISSQMRQYIPGFDEIIHENDSEFIQSGLKETSVIRVGRIAVVEEKVLLGAIGRLSSDRFERVKNRIAEWILRT